MIDAPRLPLLEPRVHRPWLAALLSFVFPGLGQAYAGAPWLAAVFAAPVVVLVAVVLLVFTGVAGNLGNSLLSSRFLLGVLVVNVALLLWRCAAIAHGGLATRSRQPHPNERRLTIAAVAVLLLATVGMHAWVGMTVVQLEGTLNQVFGGIRPAPVPPPTGSNAPSPGSSPDEPLEDGGPINILLLGTDAAPAREAVLTDVVMVISIDPDEETAVMISVPRDTGYLPLADTSVYDDGLFPEKVNELTARASRDPGSWCPDLVDEPEACGIRTIERSVGLYLGIGIDHYALVDMAGFAEMIDALGGLELCLPGQLVDPEFDGSLDNLHPGGGLILPAGCNHYNGLDALAYARSRKGWIEMPDGTREPQNDFSRSERQQLVLLALREELAEADTIIELPNVLAAIGRTVRTDFPRDQAGDLASLLPLITGPDIERVVLGHPEFVDLPPQPDLNYLLTPKRDAIREEMEDIFGATELRGWYLGSTAPGPGSESEAGSATP
ncbi:MAG: LCP family glycopolymer transferase [Chloroflexota bacterium]